MVALAPLLTPLLTHILVPLYIYPSTSRTWAPLYNSLATYPNVTFDIVINPNSGPGVGALPDASYIAGITKLHTYKNANLLGYVPTSWAARNITIVKSEIAQYAAWSKYTKSNIKMNGIFFDEAPTAGLATPLTYMASVAAHARSLNLSTITLNPGIYPSPLYYNIASTIVVFENYVSAFSNSTLTSIPIIYRKKSVFIVHDLVPATVAKMKSITQTISSYGVGGVFISSTGYSAFGGLWGDFVKVVALAA